MSTNSEVVKADRGDDRGSAVIEQTEALLNPAAVTRGQTQATVANVIVNPLEAQNQSGMFISCDVVGIEFNY